LVSCNYIIARAASGDIAPHLLALVRWSVALLLMLAVSGRALGPIWRAMRTEGWRTLLLGALGMWVCGAFVYVGAATTSAANIALIYAATPVAIAIAGARLLGEPLALGQRVGLMLATLGVLFVILKGELLNLLAVRPVVGDAWILAAGVGWVAYTVLQQRWPTVLTPPQRLTAITAGGVLVLLPFTLLEAWALAPAPPSARGLALAALAGVVPGFLAYQAYTFMVRELGATRAGLVMYLSPVYAALIAWLALGELPQWFHAVGAALILPSIYFASRPPAGRATPVVDATARKPA
jgi:drug/metabolite transporter (DMT)-like permease